MADKINLVNELYKNTQKTKNLLKLQSEHRDTVNSFEYNLKRLRDVLLPNLKENLADYELLSATIELLDRVIDDLENMDKGQVQILKEYDELIEEKILNPDHGYKGIDFNLKDILLDVIEELKEDKNKIIKQEEILNTIDRRKITLFRNNKKQLIAQDDDGNVINRRRTLIRTDYGNIKPLNMLLGEEEVTIEKGKKQLQEVRINQFSYNPLLNLSDDIDINQTDLIRMMSDHMNFKHYTEVINHKDTINDGVNRNFFSIMYDFENYDSKDLKTLKGLNELKLSGISTLNTDLIKLGNAKEYISGKENEILFIPEYMKFRINGDETEIKVKKYSNGDIDWAGTLKELKYYKGKHIGLNFIGFEGEMFINGKSYKKNFKLMNVMDDSKIRKFLEQSDPKNKSNKIITLNTKFQGQILNVKDIMQDFGYKNEYVDINKTLFFDLETTGSGKVVEYGFAVGNTGKKFSIINTNVTEKELREILETSQLKNYSELSEIIQSLKDTTDDYIEKDGVVYYKQSNDFDLIFERAGKKLGFQKNRLNTLGGYNIKNFDIPLLEEMIENKKIKSDLLLDMVTKDTIDVYDDGYIKYMLKRKGINVLSLSQELILSILKLGENKKHLGLFDLSTTLEIAEYLQTNIGGLQTNKKLQELERNIINAKNPLKIFKNKFNQKQLIDIIELSRKNSIEDAFKYMESFGIEMSKKEKNVFLKSIYKRVSRTVDGYDLELGGYDINDKSSKGLDFEFLNIQEELKKHLKVNELKNDEVKIDLSTGRYSFINENMDVNTPFFKLANIVNTDIEKDLSTNKSHLEMHQDIQNDFISREYLLFLKGRYNQDISRSSKTPMSGRKINIRFLDNPQYKKEKDLLFAVVIESLSKERQISKLTEEVFTNLEREFLNNGLEHLFYDAFYKARRDLEGNVLYKNGKMLKTKDFDFIDKVINLSKTKQHLDESDIEKFKDIIEDKLIYKSFDDPSIDFIDFYFNDYNIRKVGQKKEKSYDILIDIFEKVKRYEFDNIDQKDNPIIDTVQDVYQKKKLVNYTQNFLGLGEKGKTLQRKLLQDVAEKISVDYENDFYKIYSKIKRLAEREVLNKFGITDYNILNLNQEKVIQEFEKAFRKLNNVSNYNLIINGATLNKLLDIMKEKSFDSSMDKYKNTLGLLSFLTKYDVDYILDHFMDGVFLDDATKELQLKKGRLKQINNIIKVIDDKIKIYEKLDSIIYRQERILKGINQRSKQINSLSDTLMNRNTKTFQVKRMIEKQFQLMKEKSELIEKYKKILPTDKFSIENLRRQKKDIENFFKNKMNVTVDEYIDSTFEDKKTTFKYIKRFLGEELSSEYEEINKYIVDFEHNKKGIKINSEIQKDYKKLLDDLGIKKGLNHEEVLKNLLTFYDKLYLDVNKYSSYSDIRDFLDFMYDNFEYTSKPNNIFGQFVERQLDLSKNKKYLKKYFKNIRNNINVRENQINILEIFGFDYENKTVLKRMNEISTYQFDEFIQEMVKWKSHSYYDNVGLKSFINYMHNPKGFDYDKDIQVRMDYDDDTNPELNRIMKDEINKIQMEKYNELDNTDFNNFGSSYNINNNLENISDRRIDLMNLHFSDQLNKEIEELKKTGDYIELYKTDRKQNIKEKHVLFLEKRKAIIEEQKQEIELEKARNKRNIVIKREKNSFNKNLSYLLNDAINLNKQSNYDMSNIAEIKLMEFFKKLTIEKFDNPTNAKIFLNVLRIYANLEEQGKEFYLLELFDNKGIHLFKDNAQTTTKDFENVLKKFGELLSEIENVNGEKIDLSYMATDLIRKTIKPYDMNGVTPKKILGLSASFRQLNVNKDVRLKNILQKITDTLNSRFKDNELVKDFDTTFKEFGEMSDEDILKLFNKGDIENYFSYLKSKQIVSKTEKYLNIGKVQNLLQKLFYLMEVQKDMITKKFFAGSLLKELFEIEDIETRNKYLDKFFEDNFGQYYSSQEKELITGRGTLQKQLFDITYNFDDYLDDKDVTSVDYRQSKNLNKAIETAKQFKESLKDILNNYNEGDTTQKIEDTEEIFTEFYVDRMDGLKKEKAKIEKETEDITESLKEMLDKQYKSESGFKKLFNYFKTNTKAQIGAGVTLAVVVGLSILGASQKLKLEAKVLSLYGQQKLGSYEVEEIQFLGRPQYGVDLYLPDYHSNLVEDVINSHSETYNYDERLVNLYDGRIQKMATTGGDPYER